MAETKGKKVKKVKGYVKINILAGKATPAPPVGPALGQYGVPLMDFCKEFNARTSKMGNDIIPVVLTVYEDRTFSFITKLPPVSAIIKKTLGLEKGSGATPKETAGTLSKAQVQEIAQSKLPDLNTTDLEAAVKTVEGTARSMGVKIQE